MKDNNNEPRRMYGGKMLTEDQIEACRQYNKKYQEENGEQRRAKKREFYHKNKERLCKEHREWRDDNKAKLSESRKASYRENAEDLKAKQRKYNEENKEKIKASIKAARPRIRKQVRDRKENDPRFKITCNLRNRLYSAVKNAGASKSDSTMSLMGCDSTQLKKHLESQFTEGMTWENYGVHGWHIDHIRPCASYNLTLDSEQKACFHYSNLQPLWAEDNLKKSDKYEEL